MKKRACMQGKKMPPYRKPKVKHFFNHEFRHKLKVQIMQEYNASVDAFLDGIYPAWSLKPSVKNDWLMNKIQDGSLLIGRYYD